MSNLPKILATGFTGGFSQHPDLQARFMAWFVFSLVSMGAFTFDSWISFSVFADYLSYIGGSGLAAGLILSVAFAMAATVSAGVVAYTFVKYRRGIGTDSELSDNLRFAGYVAAFLYLTFAAVSVLANIQGANKAAENHADSQVTVDDSPMTATTSEWTSEKQTTVARFDKELAALQSRLDKLNDGTLKEKFVVDGMKGSVLWKGNKTTPYGFALEDHLNTAITAKQAERTEALAGLDNIYQTRLDTETASYKSKKGKHEEKKGHATAAIRLIVFLIYPIALLIAVFNAHFLCDAAEALAEGTTTATGHPPENHTLAGFANSPSFATGKGKIGFTLPHEDGQNRHFDKGIEPPDFSQFKQELLGEIAQMMKGQKMTASPVKGNNVPPIEHRFSSTRQPDRTAPKRHGKRADSVEARTAILAAYRAIKAQGNKPTYQAVSKATRYSVKTVGNHVREMKREGML